MFEALVESAPHLPLSLKSPARLVGEVTGSIKIPKYTARCGWASSSIVAGPGTALRQTWSPDRTITRFLPDDFHWDERV